METKAPVERPIPSGVRIINAREEHGAGVAACVRAAYGVPEGDPGHWCITAADLHQQLQRFPEGQFVASEEGGGVIGYASTMRLSRPPDLPPLAWLTAIGDMGIAAHEPSGAWLYGVEMVVRPEWRRRGVGTALYAARFALVRRLGLRGWYAGGMLMGYPDHADTLSPQEYGAAVKRGTLRDPTVTMQMNRGFQARGIIENYLPEEAPGNVAMLIVWENPEHIDSEAKS